MSNEENGRLEAKMRLWLSSSAPTTNILSKLKAQRNTDLLIRCNALTNKPTDEAIQGLSEILSGGAA